MSSVKKIVFVLTIHEALEKKLHFGMLQDAYIRILNADSKEEAVSFKMTDMKEPALVKRTSCPLQVTFRVSSFIVSNFNIGKSSYHMPL